MTLAGWLFMSVSLAAVTGVMAVCFWKVLGAPRETPDAESDEQAHEK